MLILLARWSNYAGGRFVVSYIGYKVRHTWREKPPEGSVVALLTTPVDPSGKMHLERPRARLVIGQGLSSLPSVQ